MDKGSWWRFGTTGMSCGVNMMFRAVVIACGNDEQRQILSHQDVVDFLTTRVSRMDYLRFLRQQTSA